MGTDLRSWVSEKLLSILGYSEPGLVRYVIRLSKQASSPVEIVNGLEESGLSFASDIRVFAQEIFDRVGHRDSGPNVYRQQEREAAMLARKQKSYSVSEGEITPRKRFRMQDHDDPIEDNRVVRRRTSEEKEKKELEQHVRKRDPTGTRKLAEPLELTGKEERAAIQRPNPLGKDEIAMLRKVSRQVHLTKREQRKIEELRDEVEDGSYLFEGVKLTAAEALLKDDGFLSNQGRRAIQGEEDEAPTIGDDDEDLQKSLQRARKLALQKQGESAKSGPQAIALLAASVGADNQNFGMAESKENKVVFTEMDEFLCRLHFDEEAQKPEAEDVFMEDGGWSEPKENEKDGIPEYKEDEIVPDETIHEVGVGKGVFRALKLWQERGLLKESLELSGRNMDKKNSKLVGNHDNERQKEIHIERTDKYGRTLDLKGAFRLFSHTSHGKRPGKMKQEKRRQRYQEELKQMKNSSPPLLSVERMREVQAQLKAPYIVLSGHVKPEK